MFQYYRAVAIAGALAVAACGGHGLSGPGADSAGGNSVSPRSPAGAIICGTTTAIFSVPPVALTDFAGWEPLGTLSPSGHTFPVDHQYIYINNPESQAPRRTVNVVAPGNIIVTVAHLGTTNPGNITDYTLEFSPCAETYAQFGHVLTITPSLLAQLGAFDQQCDVYSPSPGTTVSTCQTKSANIPVPAGTLLGTGGGPDPHSFALDFSLWDARVPAIFLANPARYGLSNDKFDIQHVVGASDYFSEPLKSQIAPRMGLYNGAVQRTFAPIGGSIDVDIAGTATGRWFSPTQPTYPETPHLAIAPDNVYPNRVDFSIGLSLPFWTQGLVYFTPVSGGMVNRNPSQITADGNTYCFESPGAWVLLLKMTDASTLRLEGRTGTNTSCALQQPWTFTANAFDYKR